jgi:hypothetical protein
MEHRSPRVLSIAVAIAYIVAVAAKTTPWPYAVLLGVMAVSFAAGRLLFGERREQPPDESTA